MTDFCTDLAVRVRGLLDPGSPHRDIEIVEGVTLHQFFRCALPIWMIVAGIIAVTLFALQGNARVKRLNTWMASRSVICGPFFTFRPKTEKQLSGFYMFLLLFELIGGILFLFLGISFLMAPPF